MAYLLGIIATDGNLYRSTLGFQVQQRDSDLIDWIDACFGGNHKITTRVWKGNSYVGVKINHRDLPSMLQKYGITPRKSWTLELETTGMPDDLIGHLIRGIFDGDGWVHSRRKAIETGFCSASERFINQIHSWIGHGRIRKRVRGDYNPLYVLDLNKTGSMFLRNMMYEDGGFCLERKKNIFYLEFKRSPRYWSAEEVALFSVEKTDLEISQLTHRSLRSVWLKRWKLKQ